MIEISASQVQHGFCKYAVKEYDSSANYIVTFANAIGEVVTWKLVVSDPSTIRCKSVEEMLESLW